MGAPFKSTDEPEEVLGDAKEADLDFGESMYLFNQIDNKNIIKNVLLLDGINFTDSHHLNYKGSAIYNDWFVENIKHNKPTNFTEYKLQ